MDSSLNTPPIPEDEELQLPVCEPSSPSSAAASLLPPIILEAPDAHEGPGSSFCPLTLARRPDVSSSSSSSSTSSSLERGSSHRTSDSVGSSIHQQRQALSPPLHVPKHSTPSRSHHHLRSRSSGPRTKPPSILRVNSNPVVSTMQDYQHYLPRSASPLGAQLGGLRASSPASRLREDAFTTSQLGIALADISEDDATQQRPSSQPELSRTSHTPPPSAYHSLTNRTRPASPFRRDLSRPRTPSSSPQVDILRYNESYPGSVNSLQSIPSTPTSQRSRSPSISSLETIPDSPMAEEEAAEKDIVARLKAQADAADAAAKLAAATSPIAQEVRRRSGLDGGMPFTIRDKRKRWSVCGAERSALDLETIYEDGA